jgi:DNA-directed RNA polymerase omega subunit
VTTHRGVADSKYRFIILAAKRARQIMSGAKPLLTSRSKKPVRVAQEEVAAGLVPYEVVQREKSAEERGPKATKETKTTKDTKSKGRTRKIA